MALRETTAKEVMTPRVDVVALEAPVTPEDLARAVKESGHSRFPVYEEDLDHLVGVLFVKDLFRGRVADWGSRRSRSPSGSGPRSSCPRGGGCWSCSP